MHDSDPDDATLVARCLRGDAGGWHALVQRYQRLIYAVVRRAGLDEHTAADVFQTVFSRLIEYLPRISQPERLRAWIVTTARRETLRTLEHGRRRVSMTRRDDDGGPDRESIEDTLADPAPLAEEALAELQQLDRLRHAMDRLDARCRELLALVFRDDDERLPYDEVARRLAIPQGSIGPTRARCLDKLRRLLEGDSAPAAA